jgi:hypothetical protein
MLENHPREKRKQNIPKKSISKNTKHAHQAEIVLFPPPGLEHLPIHGKLGRIPMYCFGSGHN